jgi:hypothetical protein
MNRPSWNLKDEMDQGGSIEAREDCWEEEHLRRSMQWCELVRQIEVHKKEDDFRVLQYQLVELKRHLFEAKREILGTRISVLDEQVHGLIPSVQTNRNASSDVEKKIKALESEYRREENGISHLMAQFRVRRHAETH